MKIDRLEVSPYAAHQANGLRRSSTITVIVGGFTIIEVMIVLAIAALILLVVFLAVPQLQRSQRNNARKSDASRIAAAVVDFSASKPTGALPASAADCTTVLNNSKSLSQFTGASVGSNMACSYSTAAIGSVPLADRTLVIDQPATPAAGTAPVPTTAFEVILADGYQCDNSSGAANGALTASGSKQAAVLYSLESGGNPTWGCINAQ